MRILPQKVYWFFFYIIAHHLQLSSLSTQGTLNQIGRIFILVEEAGLKPNLGSYCAALECMGRSDSCPRVVNR